MHADAMVSMNGIYIYGIILLLRYKSFPTSLESYDPTGIHGPYDPYDYTTAALYPIALTGISELVRSHKYERTYDRIRFTHTFVIN